MPLGGRRPRLARASGRLGYDPTWAVYSDESMYTVGPGATCTCAWITEFGTTRGPCKHMLAVSLTLRDPGA